MLCKINVMDNRVQAVTSVMDSGSARPNYSFIARIHWLLPIMTSQGIHTLNLLTGHSPFSSEAARQSVTLLMHCVSIRTFFSHVQYPEQIKGNSSWDPCMTINWQLNRKLATVWTINDNERSLEVWGHRIMFTNKTACVSTQHWRTTQGAARLPACKRAH